MKVVYPKVEVLQTAYNWYIRVGKGKFLLKGHLPMSAGFDLH